MTSLAEQFFAAAAGKTPFPAPFTGQPVPQVPAQLRTQFETQVDFFQSFTRQAFDSASRVLALNLATSRASVERSTRAAQALVASRDPRDVLTLGGTAEEQMHSLFDYSRELMSIAGSVQPFALGAKAPAAASQAAAPSAKAAEAPAAAVHGAAAEPIVVAEPEQEPAAEQLAIDAEPAPVAEQTEIVMAAGQGEPQAGVAPHPASAPVPAQDTSIKVQKVAPASSSSKRRK